MTIIRNDKRRKELEQLYTKPSLKLDIDVNKRKNTNIRRDSSFLLAYHPTLVKDALISTATLIVLILIQMGLARFLK